MTKRIFGVQVQKRGRTPSLIIWGRNDRGQKVVLDAVQLSSDVPTRIAIANEALAVILKAKGVGSVSHS